MPYRPPYGIFLLKLLIYRQLLLDINSRVCQCVEIYLGPHIVYLLVYLGTSYKLTIDFQVKGFRRLVCDYDIMVLYYIG